MTVVAQWAKVPAIHGYVAGSIPAVTPGYGTINVSLSGERVGMRPN